MASPNKLVIAAAGDLEIVFTRTFDAPRALVWEAMTQPELIRRWLFRPPGWTMTACEEDVRVGGAYHWAWNNESGPAMSMRGVYREVVPPARDGSGGRLVRTEKFEFGCAPQAGEQLATMLLTEERGRTLLTARVIYPSKEARDGAIASGMERGMSIGYDQLDAMLAASTAR